MSLPTTTRILPLAQNRELLRRLTEAMARAHQRRQEPLIELLAKALPLARDLEHELLQMRRTEAVPGMPDPALERTFSLSTQLGPLLKEARRQGLELNPDRAAGSD